MSNQVQPIELPSKEILDLYNPDKPPNEEPNTWILVEHRWCKKWVLMNQPYCVTPPAYEPEATV